MNAYLRYNKEAYDKLHEKTREPGTVRFEEYVYNITKEREENHKKSRA